jgi:hypothetical protein
VFILGHRHPVVMAKMLTSIDVLSSGRLICGVGVGWWKEELEILGVPFTRRGRHAHEALRVFKALWTEDNPAFEGEFFRCHDIGFAPKLVQKPHPPARTLSPSLQARRARSPGCDRRPGSSGSAGGLSSNVARSLRRASVQPAPKRAKRPMDWRNECGVAIPDG